MTPSSMIASISYNQDTQQLTINWAKGGSTTYDGVPHSVYEEMDAAESAGKYYHANIKGKYDTGVSAPSLSQEINTDQF